MTVNGWRRCTRHSGYRWPWELGEPPQFCAECGREFDCGPRREPSPDGPPVVVPGSAVQVWVVEAIYHDGGEPQRELFHGACWEQRKARHPRKGAEQ
jgi:hypothetical protein